MNDLSRRPGTGAFPANTPAGERAASGITSRRWLTRALDTPPIVRKIGPDSGVSHGFAGVEALAELEDMAKDSTRYYRNIT
ncbi:hypothetical protein AB0M50_40055, partial [Nonomuraea fuscirosea]